MSADVVGESDVAGIIEGIVVGRPFTAAIESLVNEHDRRKGGSGPRSRDAQGALDSDAVGGGERYGSLSHLGGIGASGVFRKIGLKIPIGVLERIVRIDGIEQERMAKLKEIVDAISVTVRWIGDGELMDGVERTRIDLRVAESNNRALDRKSTRLNSSHKPISYAVFCLKKKNISIPNAK